MKRLVSLSMVLAVWVMVVFLVAPVFASVSVTLPGTDAVSRWGAPGSRGFSEAVNLPGVGSFCSVAWGDYDNDGDLDVLMAGHTGSAYLTRIYRNDAGAFTSYIPLTGISRCSVAWGDYDNDGDLDVLLAGNTGSGYITRIYRNDAGAFVDMVAGLTGMYNCSVAWGDYDNDGDLDVLAAGMLSGISQLTSIYRNDGPAGFTDIGAGLPGVRSCGVAWGDYDNDGDLDVLLAGGRYNNPSLSRIYHNDAGTFTTYSSLEGVEYCSVAWGDYDSDGDLDVLLAGESSGGYITRIYRNDGLAGFSDIGASLPGVYECDVAWGDYDNDGDLDVLMAGDTGSGKSTRIYSNDGSDIFTDISAGLTGVDMCSVAWGDYDNDGDLDVLLAGYPGTGSHITRIYQNDETSTNAAPGSPSNLAALLSGQDVTLSWDKATDTETATDALTYNLRIGTSSAGGEVMPPMADASTGYRLIPALGNTNHDTTWTIQGLSQGWCYWSVQAIDNAFAGSPFAPVDSFYCLGADMTLTGTVQLDTLVLEWTTVPPAASYWVYGAFNEPYFAPELLSPYTYRVAVTADTTWSSAAGIADPDTNWTYQVIAVDGSDQELSRTNRFGEWDFDVLTPTYGAGSPAEVRETRSLTR